ncbi:MAG TPA: ABC transporter ATP-binding protein, partial [Acidimicrobiales bacterium]|nr:ABC transporter ATP-binding protein [Acidimicrobiales bacterium]
MTPAERRRAVRALLRSAVAGRGRTLAGLVLWATVQALPAFLSGHLVARALDRGFLAGRATAGFGWLAVLGAAVLVGAWATRQAYRRLAAVVEPFRDRLVEAAVRGAIGRAVVPGSAPDTAGAARLTQHVEIAREAFASLLMVVQGFVVTTAGALLGLLGLLPAALVLVVPPLLAGLALFLATLRPMAARQRESIMAEERIAEEATVMAAGIRDVVAGGGEEVMAAMVAEPVDRQARATRELASFTAVRSLAVALGGWVPVLGLLLAAPWLRDHGASRGAVVGALAYVLQGLHPALQTLVRQMGGSGLWLVVTLNRIVEATVVPPPRPVSDAAVSTCALNRAPDLSLRGVTFAYGPRAEPVIRGLDLEVPAGDHLAVVGPSGAGKSTLAGLMAGILEPQAGDVRLGDVPVARLDPRRRAHDRVLIPQEAYVFAGTVWENLTYLDPGAGPEAVDAAVDRLGARPLVERLGGYRAAVTRADLSAGEAQLLTLVRAFAAPAQLVVLDEATCHLDPVTEARVEEAFARRGGTLVVIAHRISSALRARRILVLDGPVTCLGTHAQLLDRSPLYRDLAGRWLWPGEVAAAPPP